MFSGKIFRCASYHIFLGLSNVLYLEQGYLEILGTILCVLVYENSRIFIEFILSG